MFSNAQSLSCFQEVLSLERKVTVSGFPDYKLQMTQLTGIKRKVIYLSIRSLLNKYLLSTYCVPGIVQGTASACSEVPALKVFTF